MTSSAESSSKKQRMEEDLRPSTAPAISPAPRSHHPGEKTVKNAPKCPTLPMRARQKLTYDVFFLLGLLWPCVAGISVCHMDRSFGSIWLGPFASHGRADIY